MTITADHRTILARCYVALAEVDFDLRAWSDEVYVRSVTDEVAA